MKSKIDKLKAIVVLIPLIIWVIPIAFIIYNDNVHSNVAVANNIKVNTATDNNTSNKQEVLQQKNIVIPDSLNISVPFITQAPFFQWKVWPFNHSCEEASAMMLHYFLSGKKTVDENVTQKEIIDLVNFENQKYGFSDDSNAADTARFIKDYWGYDAQVFYNITSDDIKKELVQGNPVIVPTAGRLLFNPHFTPPGPIAHMLVIKGYDSSGFITNDPGTYRSGIDYKYPYNVMENAIKDFDYTDKNADGPSAMIVVTLPKASQ